MLRLLWSMASIHRFFLSAVTVALTAATAVAGVHSTPSTRASSKARIALQEARVAALNAETFYEILLGEITTRTGDSTTGFALMLDAARSRNDEKLYQRAADIALQARSGEAALSAARAWQQAWPQSREANRYILQILIALNRVSDTVTPLKQALLLAPAAAKASTLLALPPLYRRVSDKTLAASLVEQALAPQLQQPDTSPTAWAVVSRLRLQADDLSGALQAAQQAQSMAPNDESTILLGLELLERGHAAALSLLEPYFAQAHVNTTLRLGYSRLLLSTQRYADAQAQLQLLTGQVADQAENWFFLAAVQVQNNQLTEAEASLAKFITLTVPPAEAAEEANTETQATTPNRGLTQAYLLHAQIAEKRGQYPKADDWLNRINHPDDKLGAQIQRAALLARQGKLDKARALLHKIAVQAPQQEQIKLQAEVQLLRDAKQYAQAYQVQTQLVALAPDNNDMAYDQATLAEKLGHFDEMERILRKIIERQPDFHHAYNALGYSLTERGVRLSEAKVLIETALSHAPNDSFIIDSLGWVQFRLGETTQALALIESAFALRPDAEIAAHLGEVLWSLKQTDRAQTIWKQAFRLQPDNEALQSTMRRFGIQP